MFVNFSNNPHWGTPEVESIPPSRFTIIHKNPEVRRLFQCATLLISTIGFVLALCNRSDALEAAKGVGACVGGLSLTFLANSFDKMLTSYQHGYRFFHRTTQIEEYKNLLSQDQALVYFFEERTNFKEWFYHHYGSQNLRDATREDLHRLTFCYKGELIDSDQLENKYGLVFPFANQRLLTYLHWLLQSRYANSPLRIMVQMQEAGFNWNPDTGMLTGLLKAHLVRALYEADLPILGRIKGSLHLNFRTGAILFCWQSPKKPKQT